MQRSQWWNAARYAYHAHLRNFAFLRYRHWFPRTPDGLAVPPARMRWLVIGTTDVEMFFETANAQVNELIIPLLARNGLSMTDFGEVLDFGCGCGRIIRHWRDLEGVALCGMDYNRHLIDWCRRNLPFAEFRQNQLEPPLPCDANRFDFIYVRSVFTHLTERLQDAWIRELRRVLKPNGTLLFTVSGTALRHTMNPDEWERFQNDELAVREPHAAGSNDCAAFHPNAYVAKRWPELGFEIVDRLPGGRVRFALQDTYLARKRG